MKIIFFYYFDYDDYDQNDHYDHHQIPGSEIAISSITISQIPVPCILPVVVDIPGQPIVFSDAQKTKQKNAKKEGNIIELTRYSCRVSWLDCRAFLVFFFSQRSRHTPDLENGNPI